MSTDKEKYFANKYRIPSARLHSWNYGWDGTYFITICTQGRVYYFGDIVETPDVVETQNLASLPHTPKNEMQLSPLGQHAHQCAVNIPLHFPFVQMNELVIMPNHVHLLFTIHKTNKNTPANTVQTQNLASQTIPNNNETNETQNFASDNDNNRTTIETQDFASLPGNRFGAQSGNVASIIRGFKIGVTKFARNNHIDFCWQTRFHDHIVRNPQEYNRIQDYIQSNVANWKNDSLK